MIHLYGNGVKIDTGKVEDIRDAPDYSIFVETDKGYKINIHISTAIDIAKFMLMESEINESGNDTKGHHQITKLKNEISEEVDEP